MLTSIQGGHVETVKKLVDIVLSYMGSLISLGLLLQYY